MPLEVQTLEPWSVNIWLLLLLAGTFVALGAFIWLWNLAGRSKREKKVPFDRTAEDFAGTVQAAYGQIPNFVIIIIIVTLIAIGGYVVVSAINGVQY